MPPTTKISAARKRLGELEKPEKKIKRLKLTLAGSSSDETLGSSSKSCGSKNTTKPKRSTKPAIYHRVPSVRHASMKANMILQSQTKVKDISNNHDNSPTTTEGTNFSKTIEDLPNKVLAQILTPLQQPFLNKLAPLRFTNRRWAAVISLMFKSTKKLRLTITTREELREKGHEYLVKQIPLRDGWNSLGTIFVCRDRLSGKLARNLYHAFNANMVMLHMKDVCLVWVKRPRPVSAAIVSEDQKIKDEPEDLIVSVVEIPNSSESDVANSSSSLKPKNNRKQPVIRRTPSIRHASMKAALRLSFSNSTKVNKKSSQKSTSSASALNINDLPNEMLCKIFSFLKRPLLNGLVPHRLTCSHWNALILAMCKSIRSARLRIFALDELSKYNRHRDLFTRLFLELMPPQKRLQETLAIPRGCNSNSAFLQLLHKLRLLLPAHAQLELHFPVGPPYPKKVVLLNRLPSTIFDIIFEYVCTLF